MLPVTPTRLVFELEQGILSMAELWDLSTPSVRRTVAIADAGCETDE